MSDSTKDRTEGAFDKTKGNVKENVGEARNDDEQVAEGKTDQASGEGKQGLANIKDKVNDAVKKITNND